MTPRISDNILESWIRDLEEEINKSFESNRSLDLATDLRAARAELDTTKTMLQIHENTAKADGYRWVELHTLRAEIKLIRENRYCASTLITVVNVMKVLRAEFPEERDLLTTAELLVVKTLDSLGC